MPRTFAWTDRLRLPLIVAPMFLASGPDLVVAVLRQRIVGTFPALNARTSDALRQWLATIEHARAGLDRAIPYGINLIVHKTNPRLAADLDVLEAQRVPLVITSLGAVAAIVERVHGWGGQVLHDVTTLRHAQKAAEAGVDGIVAVAAGAGGHAGTVNPFALLTEIRRVYDGPLVLAGALSHGRHLLAARAAGADLAYMGTRFIATDEAAVDPAYKQMLVDCAADDVLYTPAVSGVPANFLRPSLVRAGYDMQRLQQPGAIDYGEKLKAADEEARAWKTVWSAGHGVGGIDAVLPVAALCDRLEAEYRDGLDALRTDPYARGERVREESHALDA